MQYLQPFCWGLLLADLHASGGIENLQRWSDAPFATLIAGLAAVTAYAGSYPVFNTSVVDGQGTIWSPLGWMFGWFWISLGGAALVLSLLLTQPLQRFFGSPPVLFVGRASFGIYLTHYILLCAMDAVVIPAAAAAMGPSAAAIVLLCR